MSVQKNIYFYLLPSVLDTVTLATGHASGDTSNPKVSLQICDERTLPAVTSLLNVFDYSTIV